jgi:hypothetical protein
MKIMTIHTSATAHQETPHETETFRTINISDALRRRAQSVINDLSIDAQWRSIIRYALGVNDPFLADLVRRADKGETIIEAIDFSQTPETNEDDSSNVKAQALAEMICHSSDRSAAALFVLMATLETSPHPKLLANAAKHVAFSHCADANLYGIVDAQIQVVEGELLTEIAVS